MNKKITGIVAYFSWIGWLIAFLAGDKAGARFHLNQSLVLMLVNLVWSVIVTLLPIPGVITWIVNIAFTIFWILGLVYAIKEENKELPLIGSIRILK